MIYNVSTSMASKGVAHCKDDIIEFVVILKVVNNNPKKV